jgi:hypothetical protein|uniref:Uncharacterized protein n=1 Tax=Marinobacter nauticus TaxID=2743 RepID=A0A455W0G7_MARNT|nr:hypothetical protein YBY_00790 [Marinobacter nauticus]|tara:strand:+ start:310 stop:504 length:195 start_codon:yes stop_codon:yes gene_type:complete
MEKYHEQSKNTDVAGRCCTYSERDCKTAWRNYAERLFCSESPIRGSKKYGVKRATATEWPEHHG